jgi:hypothetical protein
MTVTDGGHVLGFPASRRAYRPWSITERWLRAPAARFPKGWCAATRISTVHTEARERGNTPSAWEVRSW